MLRSFHSVSKRCGAAFADVRLLWSQDLAAKKAIWGSEVSEDMQLDKDKLQAALKKAAEKEQEETEKDERKRKYNSMSHDIDVTNEDMEAYRMVRNRADDPLNEMQALKNAQYGYV